MEHSLDSDEFHFPGNSAFNVHEWTSEKVFGGPDVDLYFPGLTKFMFIELVVAGLMLLLMFVVGWNLRRNGYAKGWLANLIEAMMGYVRDNIARVTIGHDADKHVPYLWSLFFFILGMNLFGMIPWMGSPTGALGCTFGLAACTFIYIHTSGIIAKGPVGYVAGIVPKVPWPVYFILGPVEAIGHTVKPIMLAFRLFVNMMAGHTVLFVILGFIEMTGASLMNLLVTPASVLGTVAISLLELFVAFLQAYIFTFLSSLFIGDAVSHHH
ncbi:F0F1 ATP synthase subunit A [Kolteria novifilia]